jgi:hypothetical protein
MPNPVMNLAPNNVVATSSVVLLALVALVTVWMGFPMAGAGTTDIDGLSIVPAWSSPVLRDWPAGRPMNVVDMVPSSSGPIILLTDSSSEGQSGWLVQPDAPQPERLISFPIARPWLRLAAGANDTLWIGGRKNLGLANSIAPVPLSDAYLAKSDRRGHVLWERTFGANSEREIKNMTPLPSGDVVVAGLDNRLSNRQTWLARISSDGDIVWQRSFSGGKGAAVTTAGDKIIVAAFQGEGKGAAYQDNVGAWIFDDSGQLLKRSTVREGINPHEGHMALTEGGPGDLWLQTSTDAAYIFSRWWTTAPLAVAKLSLDGEVAWRTVLPDTLLKNPDPRPSSRCRVGSVVLANGSALIACFTTKAMTLFHLNSESGEAVRTSVAISTPPPSDCHNGWFGTPILTQRSDGAASLFVWRSGRCTWTAQIPPGFYEGENRGVAK